MPSPFDYINAITQENKNLVLSGSLDPKEYNPFMVNRGLSLYMDTVLFANEMNIRPDIPKDAQFHFLHGLISKRKRFSKWPKKMVGKGDEKLFEVLMKNYRYSLEKCIEITKLLTPEQKAAVIEEFEIVETKRRKSK